MLKYIHYFSTESEYNQKRGNDYIEPWVSYTEEKGIDYNKTNDEILLETPFTIEALGSGDIIWYLDDKTLQYSKNGGTWETMTGEATISVIEGDEVQFKGTNTDYNEIYMETTMQFNVKGNIMSLTDGDNFKTADTVNENAFCYLFSDSNYLVSAGDLKLPATTLASYCYEYMFYRCTSLTTAPSILPAMTLASNCYNSMFSSCTSLTTAPQLPATTLASNCYASMFSNCTSLTTAPELPATTLVNNCYNYMFSDCTNLNYIKAMFTTTPSTSYTRNWVNGVSATGTFVKNSTAQWNVSDVNGIPSGWTVQTASE